MKDSYDYRGDTQIDIDDKTAPPSVAKPVAFPGLADKTEDTKDLSKKEIDKAGSNEEVDEGAEGTLNRTRKKKKGIRQSFQSLNLVRARLVISIPSVLRSMS